MPVVETISREELKAGMADGSIVLVDVRESHEYDAGHIPGAILNPLSVFDPSALPREAGKRVVLQCRSGRRTLSALELAQQAGRTDVTVHYEGGMLDWAGAGEKIVTY